MASRIDRFNQRLKKMNKINGQETAKDSPVVDKLGEDDINIVANTHEEALVTPEVSAMSEVLLREESLKAAIGGIVGKQFIKQSAVGNNEGFIFDILSNAVSFGEDTQTASDFILYENDLFAVNPHSIIDTATDIVVNVRTAYIKNDLKIAASLVGKTLLEVAKNGDRFYILPDNTDFFAQNIKAAFGGGFRFIWRSIIAAYACYEKNSDAKDISVIDLFENEPAQIDVKIESSQIYGTHIFTRRRKTPIKELNPLSYRATAIAFWRAYGNKIGTSLDAENLALTGDTFGLLCNGKSFTLLYSGKPYRIEAQTAKAVLTDYFRKHNNAISGLSGCVVFADHLKNVGIRGNFEYIESIEIGRGLAEFKRRLKNGIPLWQETLPKLALQRIAVNGRLGEYILVDDGKTIPNTFGVYSVPREEKLMLPAGHKVIKFPLTISGINNKSFIAKVELEEELTCETAFDVMLKYDFNNENSYDFEITREKRKYTLVIEEGMPEKQNLSFEMKIEDDNSTIEAIYNELGELWREVNQRQSQILYVRKYDDNNEPKKRFWEHGTRRRCKKITSLLLRLSYLTREKKTFPGFEPILSKISQQILDAYGINEGDNIDKCHLGLIHATLALFSDDYAFNDACYNYYTQCRTEGDWLDFVVESIILCNPTFDKKTIDRILDSCKGETIIRTFSLPFLANDELLYYVCSNKREWLNEATVALTALFNKISRGLKKPNPYQVRLIREGYEFILGLLKLRGEEYWRTVKNIEKLLEPAIEIESALYKALSGNTIQATEFIDFYTAQNWCDKNGKPLKNHDLLLSRITFEGDEKFKNLRLMHPLALTAITYLEGNPDIHIIGCGLKDEID